MCNNRIVHLRDSKTSLKRNEKISARPQKDEEEEKRDESRIERDDSRP